MNSKINDLQIKVKITLNQTNIGSLYEELDEE